MARVNTIIVGGGIQADSPFTTGTIALIVNSDPATIGDSIMSESSGVITLNGSLSVGTEASKRNVLSTGTTTNGNLRLGRTITDGGANNAVLIGSTLTIPSTAQHQTLVGDNIVIAGTPTSALVAIGQQLAGTTIGKVVMVGRGLTVNSSGVVAIGDTVTVNSALSDIIIIKAEQGTTTTTIGHSDHIGLGGASSTAANQCMIGGGSIDIRSLIVGIGDTAAVAGVDRTIRCTNMSATTDTASGNLVVQAPRSTGNALPGDIKFQIGQPTVSGTTLQTATNGAIIRYSAVAGDTYLMVYDVDNGQLERVSVGAADSGGAGFKVLRIPN